MPIPNIVWILPCKGDLKLEIQKLQIISYIPKGDGKYFVRLRDPTKIDASIDEIVENIVNIFYERFKK